jgi:two-component system sensor histidine kinase BaeS
MDPDRMSQVLGNLFSNAIKYTPSGGTVSVEAKTDENELRVCVSDTGPGIDPQGQAHIFEPFYRINSNVYSAHGLGLGLTIVRDLVRAHGGEVDVASEPGHGSHFTLRLPVK